MKQKEATNNSHLTRCKDNVFDLVREVGREARDIMRKLITVYNNEYEAGQTYDVLRGIMAVMVRVSFIENLCDKAAVEKMQGDIRALAESLVYIVQFLKETVELCELLLEWANVARAAVEALPDE